MLFRSAHESPLTIHLGSTKMYQDLRQRFWWTRMKREIAQYIANCDISRRVKPEHQQPAGTLQPLAIPEWKWDKIGMDFITGFPRTRKGNNAIFIVIDRLSKVAHFLPVRESITAIELADLYISRIVSLHGVPLEINSDRGSLFTSRFSESFQNAPSFILSQVVKWNESIKFWKTCFEPLSFLSVWNGKNVFHLPNSLITIAIKPAWARLPSKFYMDEGVKHLLTGQKPGKDNSLVRI